MGLRPRDVTWATIFEATENRLRFGEIPKSAAFCPARDVGAVPASNGELVQVHILHQSEQRQTLARSQLASTLLEPPHNFSVGADAFDLVEPISFARSLEQ